MNALRLAISLVRIPRLFISLILFPLLFSLVIVYLQLLATGMIVKAANSAQKTKDLEQAMKAKRDRDLIRQLIYPDGDPKPIRVCRWIIASDGISEIPPSSDCYPDRLDIAIRTSEPATFQTSEYESLLNGTVELLHVCRRCAPDVIIDTQGEKVKSEVHSLWGLWLLGLSRFNDERITSAAEAFKDVRKGFELIGPINMHSAGFRESIQISGSLIYLAIVGNIAALVVITLWLALKAHRKVLDYFARSGALLPMVAATGKGSFYAAIWIVTLMRVLGFILAAVPLTYFGMVELLNNEQRDFLFRDDMSGFSLWMLALLASFGLATIIASIAELKHRHMVLSFSYKYIPLIICSAGGVFWAATFVVDGEFFGVVRNIITALPLVGTTSVLVSPVFKPPLLVLIAHTLLTMYLVVVAVRSNARWFAAHLEDL